MFGTIATMRPKAGQADAVAEFTDRWWRERSGIAEGAVCLHLYRGDDSGQLVMAVVFESEELYRVNADDPEQDQWYQQLVELLEAPPEWADGDVVVSHSSGLDTVGITSD